MSFIFVKLFELPCVERCYINKLALPCLALPLHTNHGCMKRNGLTLKNKNTQISLDLPANFCTRGFPKPHLANTTFCQILAQSN